MTAVGTNSNHVQDYNRRIVLSAIRLSGPLSRADIARKTRLSSPAVSSIVASLRDAGYVREAGVRSIDRGRSPLDFEIDPDGAFSIGLYLSRDVLVGVLVDFVGTSRAQRSAVVSNPTPEVVLPQMRAFIDDFASQIGPDRLRGVGVGLPGPLEHYSGGVAPSDLPGWKGVEIAKALDPEDRLAVSLENNATAAAIGETWHGVGRRFKTFYYIFFGLGLGGGVVTDGRPYRGATGNAARFGHTLTHTRDGTVVRLESIASLAYIYESLAEAGADATTPGDLQRLHDARDPLLAEILDRIADALVVPIVNLERQFDPEAIVFGGRMPRALSQDLLVRLDRRITALATDAANHPVLTLAEAGDEVAALGAATLPLYEALAPDHDLVVLDDR